jgi:hypothetical protein
MIGTLVRQSRIYIALAAMQPKHFWLIQSGCGWILRQCDRH